LALPRLPPRPRLGQHRRRPQRETQRVVTACDNA
jgi:hypothetical protein